MKKIILSIAVAMLFAVTSFAQTTDASFGVRGNCEMCKATIEKAATSIEGVTKAVWDKENKKINVSFDASKTSVMNIETAIAGAGYDTENIKASTESYAALSGCCQYAKDMKMAKGKTCTDKKKCCSKTEKKSCVKKTEE
jgi:copper chaperone CopZ